CLSLMNGGEIEDLARAGVDIQLHTHRHRFPLETAKAAQEIADNRAVLEGLVGKPLRHFCYPSGIWSEQQWPVLAANGIETATTCDPGLNYRSTPRLGLKRFCDAENISQIEFEAEVFGYTELLRWVRARLGDVLRTVRFRGRHTIQPE